MSFLYPLGLLGLIGIPILIVIYIIKSKYTEQIVSSTYLWTLSERFLKRKNPVSKVTGIISLILQILAIAIISFAIAHPIITLPDSANEYCFILDASGSMNMQDGGKTRFEKGKEKISAIIDDSANGSIYSLLYVGDTTNIVYEKTESKEQATNLLSELSPVYNRENFTRALGVAQKYFDENPSAKTYLITDKPYRKTENIELIDVSASEANCGISDVKYTLLGDKLEVVGKVTSYRKDSTLSLSLYVNDGETSVAKATTVAKEAIPTNFYLSATVSRLSSLRVTVDNEDSLGIDNEYMLFNQRSENVYDTLIVSDSPFFLKSVLNVFLDAEIDVVSTEEYSKGVAREYGLYVFDSFSPEKLPKNSAVWFINPRSDVEGSGFSVRQSAKATSNNGRIEMTDDSSSLVRVLTENLTGDVIQISEYMQCSAQRAFTALYTYEHNPIIFAGTNDYGNREVVIAFDLHNSILPLLADYSILVKNFIDFSFPEIVEKTDYTVGETVNINFIAGCKDIRIDAPSGEVTYLDSELGVGTFIPKETGVHTVTMNVSGRETQFNIFVALEADERVPNLLGEEIKISGVAESGGYDGKYDPLTVLFIVLAIVFVADWVVYCYEKYQLR